MLISLVVIRLEIADGCELPVKFKTYCAKNFDCAVDSRGCTVSKPSYALVTKQSPSSSKESSPPVSKSSWTSGDSIAEHRGLRKNTDITLEFLSSEVIQTMEKEARDMDTQQRSRDEARKRQHSKSSSPDAAPAEGLNPKPPVGDTKDDNKEVDARGAFHQVPRRAESQDHSAQDCDEPGPTPETPGKRRRSRSPSGRQSNLVHFISGNPHVELVKGILHMYKDSQKTSLEQDVSRSEMLCMMAIPAAYTIHDLIKFTAPLNGSMESMQVLRGAGGVRNQYMLLIKFKDQSSADEFYMYFNSRPFNSIEADICHLVYVAKMEIMRESEGGSLPIPGLTELPQCPVCLERMEESVEGVLTVLCNHSFHMSCLAQWGDSTCPVCRYCQTPEEVPDQRCMECGSQESLWICLICGSVGCGRYVELHAYKHFQETNHTYAMQLGTDRVWDYAGDNYVHRLAQNKSDGKLVQLDEGGNGIQEEKVDSITLEYTYLLTTQLESQRRYFEEKILEETKEANRRVTEMEEQLKVVAGEKSQISQHLSDITKEKHLLDKKCTQMHGRLSKALTELQEEKELNRCLRDNQQLWQQRVDALETSVRDLSTSKDKEVEELREQLRDVMFYLEAQEKLAATSDVSQEEIQEGQVIVGAAAATSPLTSESAGGKKRSKKRK
ncbi:BRCA1-associated protein-like [Babylonia areolata]|uniref:BRCA1-associated protein-like n=1 Tax=Babylonia areolata TaxID=304850 RepID=UPI003FD2B427